MTAAELALLATALVAATISGMLGMGGGTILIAIMATLLPPGWVVPLHGLVQMTSNGSRAILLVRNVCWWAFWLYVPTQLLGVLVAREIYQGSSLDWLRPVVGGFLVFSVAWRHLRPKRWMAPRWAYAVGGFGGGLLTIFVGVTGPYLAAFFLREDMEKEQIVATKAVIQLVGHAAKIPVFLSLGFPYREHFDLVAPLLLIAVVGTFIGTRLLRRMQGENFRRAFEAVLLVLAARLLADPLF
ncbi:MAG TPA: sulfite exporter TauE/SafE family protein [Candidatus Krumholzibacteria bacterium]|jgi:uncharacterized membrane protein YfcA